MFPAEVPVLLSNPSASLSAASGNKNFKKEKKKKRNPNLHQYGFSCFSKSLPEANAGYIPAILIMKTVSRVQN